MGVDNAHASTKPAAFREIAGVLSQVVTGAETCIHHYEKGP